MEYETAEFVTREGAGTNPSWNHAACLYVDVPVPRACPCFPSLGLSAFLPFPRPFFPSLPSLCLISTRSIGQSVGRSVRPSDVTDADAEVRISIWDRACAEHGTSEDFLGSCSVRPTRAQNVSAQRPCARATRTAGPNALAGAVCALSSCRTRGSSSRGSVSRASAATSTCSFGSRQRRARYICMGLWP